MPRRARRALRLGAALAACASVGGLVVRASAVPPARLHLHGGAAWVASAAVGQLTLIDGSTAEVVARVAVAAPGADLASAQDGPAGYGIDRDDGSVVRVDPATLEAGARVQVVAGARGDLSVHPDGDRLYVVDHTRGRVAVADADGLRLQGPLRSLAEPAAASVVDGNGRLWILGARSGDLTWFEGDSRGSRRRAVPDPATAALTVVAGRAAVVELGARLVRTLDGGGGAHARACVDADPGDDSVAIGGSVRGERLYVVSGDDGILRVSNLGSGRCGDVAVAVASPHSRLGAPQEAQGHVFVPDYSRGTVAVVDLDAQRVVHTGALVAPGTRFELFAEDGIVFYNDPGSERAGVVAVDGSFSAVAKYDPDRPGVGLARGGGTGPRVPDATDRSGGEEGAAGANGRGPGGATASPPADPARPDEPGPSAGPPPPPDEPGAGAPPPTPADPTGAPRDPGVPPLGDAVPPGGDLAVPPLGDPVPPGGDPAVPPPGDAVPPGGDPGVPPPPGDAVPPGGDPAVPPPGDPVPPAPAAPTFIVTGPAVRTEVGQSLALGTQPGDPATPLVSVTWDFGDGTRGSGLATAHAWGAPGTYHVVATGTFAIGDPVQAPADIVVVPPAVEPLAARFGFGPTPIHAGDAVTFTDQSSGMPTSWAWSFEGVRGPPTAPEQNPTRFFDFVGSYTVTLTVGRGAESSTTSKTITVIARPPDPPEVSDLVLNATPPLDDQTSYEVFAILISGQADTCTFTIEGVGTDCVTGPSHAGIQLSVFHTFHRGTTTVVLHVVGQTGQVTRSLDVTVP